MKINPFLRGSRLTATWGILFNLNSTERETEKVDDMTENTLTCDQCSHKQVCIFGLASKVYTCITVMLNQ